MLCNGVNTAFRNVVLSVRMMLEVKIMKVNHKGQDLECKGWLLPSGHYPFLQEILTHCQWDGQNHTKNVILFIVLYLLLKVLLY